MRRATSQTEAPGAKASATIDRFCSVLHRRRRSGPDKTSTRLIALSLAPVQITVLHRCQNKTDHPSARKAAPNGRLRFRSRAGIRGQDAMTTGAGLPAHVARNRAHWDKLADD